MSPTRLHGGGHRLLEQARVAARVHEAGEQLGVVAVASGFVQKTADGLARPAGLGLEVRVELVSHREPRVQGDSPLESVFRTAVAVGRGGDVLADHTMAATQMSPRRSEVRVELEAL